MTDFDTTTQNETASTAESLPGDKRRERERRERIADEAKTEASAMFKEGMKHPSTKPVLKGAAIGAVAGIILPIVGPLIGAAAGGGYAFYKRLNSVK
ncbi:hypothetical protein [Altererythrobacter sp. MTPC7]|uniref:hypothetical protein n=1 Tax=Altererythrobacter sp. MTPC7 TaxID=3056567 RepID=UPI0036F37FC8